MSREHHYQLAIKWDGPAKGPTTSYPAYSREYAIEIEGKPSLRGSADPMFKGDRTLHNPEELLVAALSSCHMLSFLAEASKAGLSILGYSDEAEGTMIVVSGGANFSNVTLHPHVIVPPGTDAALVETLHEQAHASCFITRSVNFPVDHQGTIAFEEG